MEHSSTKGRSVRRLKPALLPTASCDPVRNDDLVLDFFAGSGTTAHAVLDLNKQDGGNRSSSSFSSPSRHGSEEYPTIADITKEAYSSSHAEAERRGHSGSLGGGPKPDRGFRVFKLAESNFKPWNADATRKPWRWSTSSICTWTTFARAAPRTIYSMKSCSRAASRSPRQSRRLQLGRQECP